MLTLSKQKQNGKQLKPKSEGVQRQVILKTQNNIGMNTTETRRFWQGIELIRSIDHDTPIQYLSAFLLIALKEQMGEPLEILDLSKLLGMTEASTSRAASYLSEVGYRGKTGLGLIRKEEDVMDRRRKRLLLTPKGKGIIFAIDRALTGTLQQESVLKEEKHAKSC